MATTPPLTDDQQQVLDAVSRVEADGHEGWLHQVAEAAGREPEATREVLSGLLNEHDLVVEVPTPPEEGEDLGPRYRVKQRP